MCLPIVFNKVVALARVGVIIVLFALTFWGIKSVDTVAQVPITQPLANFPKAIDGWEFIGARTLSGTTVSILGVDDYIEYDYRSPDGIIINLYVSYFSAVGITGEYHSPKNCMPGSGWQVAEVKPRQLQPATQHSAPLVIQDMLMKKGGERQKVYYWFQNRGRIISSEYWEKIFLVWDAILKKRRDGTFVRLVVPVPEGEEKMIDQRAGEFAAEVIKTLRNFIPGENLV